MDENNKWSAISNIATSPWVLVIATIVLVAIVVAIIAVKKGWFKFKTKNIVIGNRDAEHERGIIRTQFLYAEAFMEQLYEKVPKWEGRDEWRAKCVLQYVLNTIERAITLNHITSEPTYRDLKKAEIRKVILQNTDSPEVRNENFLSMVDAEVDRCYTKLEEIRKFESK